VSDFQVQVVNSIKKDFGQDKNVKQLIIKTTGSNIDIDGELRMFGMTGECPHCRAGAQELVDHKATDASRSGGYENCHATIALRVTRRRTRGPTDGRRMLETKGDQECDDKCRYPGQKWPGDK